MNKRESYSSNNENNFIEPVAEKYGDILNGLSELITKPSVLNNEYKYVHYMAEHSLSGDLEDGYGPVTNAAEAYDAISSLIGTKTLNSLNSEQHKKVKQYLSNKTLLSNAYKHIEAEAMVNMPGASWAISLSERLTGYDTISNLISTKTLDRLNSGQQKKIKDILSGQNLLNHIFLDIEALASNGRQQQRYNAAELFQNIATLINTKKINNLNTEQLDKIKEYLTDETLLNAASEISVNFLETEDDISRNNFAYKTTSSLVTIKDYFLQSQK